MKALQLAVVLLIVCTCTALRCNRCVPSSAGGSCTTTVETCRRNDDVCASVVHSSPFTYSHFKRCMKRSDAFILDADDDYEVFTCTTDRCN